MICLSEKKKKKNHLLTETFIGPERIAAIETFMIWWSQASEALKENPIQVIRRKFLQETVINNK